MKRILPNIILFLVSIGWLIPIFMAAISFDSWVLSDVFPLLYNKEKPINSFPFFQTSEFMILLGFGWFAIVVIGWAAYIAFVLKPFNKSRSDSAR